MKKIALRNDTTTHGGSLAGTGLAFTLDNRPCVLCGEIFECPEHGTEHVVYLNTNVHINNVPVALDGFYISCGAVIIASSLHQAQEI